jgi:hypothetical protein
MRCENCQSKEKAVINQVIPTAFVVDSLNTIVEEVQIPSALRILIYCGKCKYPAVVTTITLN